MAAARALTPLLLLLLAPAPAPSTPRGGGRAEGGRERSGGRGKRRGGGGGGAAARAGAAPKPGVSQAAPQGLYRRAPPARARPPALPSVPPTRALSAFHAERRAPLPRCLLPCFPREALPGGGGGGGTSAARGPRAPRCRRLHLCGLGAGGAAVAGPGLGERPFPRRAGGTKGGRTAATGGGGLGRKSRPAAGRGRRRQSHADKGRGEPRFVWLPARRARRRSAFSHWRRVAPHSCPEGRPALGPGPSHCPSTRAAGRRQSLAEGNGSFLQAPRGVAASTGPRGGGRRREGAERSTGWNAAQLQRRNSAERARERALCPAGTLGAHPRC